MDNLDEFSKKIQEKLSSHSVTPDEGVWQAIQDKMNKPPKTFPSWVGWTVLYWGLTTAAMVALILTVKIFFGNTDKTPFSEDELIAVVEEAASDTIIQEEPTSEEIFQESLADIPLVEQSSSKESKKSNLDISADDAIINTTPDIDDIAVEVYLADSEGINDEFEELQYAESQFDIEDIEGLDIATNQALQTIEEADQQPEKQEFLLAETPAEDWTDVYAQNQPKKKRISISGVLGSGVGSSPSSIKPRSYSFRNEQLVNIPVKHTNVATPRDFSNKDYMPPISAGLNLRLPLNDRFSLESGMTYTVLRTRLSNSFSLADVMASIDLHYLGVPANLVYSFVKTNKWDVYISSGAMLEKGLQGDYKQLQDRGDHRILVQANPYIDGVQWSLNGTVGMGYSFHQHIAFFFDPKVSYYLDNDQPYSIRSEKPFIFSLNTGIRFAL